MEFRKKWLRARPLAICFLAVAAVAYASTMASGCPSALLLAPTTDVCSPGSFSMEYQGDSTTPVANATAKQFINTEFGLATNFEAGVDLDVSDDAHGRPILNGKYRFELSPLLSAAVGAQSVDSRFKSMPYVTSCLETPVARLTLGALHYQESTSWFVGLDRPITERVTAMTDYVSGDDLFASVGFSYELTRQFSLVAGAEFPNADGDTVYTLHFVACQQLW